MPPKGKAMVLDGVIQKSPESNLEFADHLIQVIRQFREILGADMDLPTVAIRYLMGRELFED